MKVGEECPLQGKKEDQDSVSLGGLMETHSSKLNSSLGAGQEKGHLRRRIELTKMSPFRSSPGSMVIQMLAWLSPGMLLREREVMKESAAAEEAGSLLPSSPPPPSSRTQTTY